MPPRWLPVESADRALDLLEHDFRAVSPGGTIRIFCGAASPSVYGADRFLDAVLTAINPPFDATVIVLAGPVLLRDATGSSGLIRTKKEVPIPERYQLHHRLIRGADAHFRLTPTKRGHLYYEEYPHPLLAPVEILQYLNRKALAPGSQEALANSALQVFNGWLNHSEMLAPTPLLGAEEGIRRLMVEAAKQNQSFDYLSPADLLKLAGAPDVLHPYAG